jgi:hypothetical protein
VLSPCCCTTSPTSMTSFPQLLILLPNSILTATSLFDLSTAPPTCALIPSDVEGYMEALGALRSAFHGCFARSEPRAHCFDSMVGQCSKLACKSSEPMALHVEGGTIRGMQRFMSDVRGDEE